MKDRTRGKNSKREARHNYEYLQKRFGKRPILFLSFDFRLDNSESSPKIDTELIRPIPHGAPIYLIKVKRISSATFQCLRDYQIDDVVESFLRELQIRSDSDDSDRGQPFQSHSWDEQYPMDDGSEMRTS